MPLFQEPAQSPERAELQAWQRSVEVAQHAVRNGIHGDSYQNFGNDNATTEVLTPAYDAFANPGLEDGNNIGADEVGLPAIDTTLKQAQSQDQNDDDDDKDSAPTSTPSLYSKQGMHANAERCGYIPVALHTSLTNTSDPFPRLSHADTGAPCTVPFSLKPSGPQTMAKAFDSLQGLQDQGTATLHQRRMASMPSPLDLQRMGQMDSQVSPVPNRLVPRAQEMQKSSNVFQYYQSGKEERERVVSLDKNDGSAGSIPTQFHGFSSNVPGHVRQPTDPFVDCTSDASNRMLQSPTRYLLPGQSSGRVPRFTAGLTPSHSAFTHGFAPKQTLPPVFFETAPNTPAWSTSAPAAFAPNVPPSIYACPSPHEHPRLSLPIPPPPIPSLQNHYTQDPATHSRLDSQKRLRAAWIRTEASNIAQLSRLRYQAEQLYSKTQAQKDYDLWQQAEAAFADATSLEKRQEERRGLFLQEKGMLPLKTGRREDMSAAMRRDAEVGVGGEHKLLGFAMALMERVCAEVKERKGGEGEGGITEDMLVTLSLEEKKALRAHLVTRLPKQE